MSLEPEIDAGGFGVYVRLRWVRHQTACVGKATFSRKIIRSRPLPWRLKRRKRLPGCCHALRPQTRQVRIHDSRRLDRHAADRLDDSIGFCELSVRCTPSTPTRPRSSGFSSRFHRLQMLKARRGVLQSALGIDVISTSGAFRLALSRL